MNLNEQTAPTFCASATPCASEPLIQGEVDWINYLAGFGGVSVAKAVLSTNHRLVEAIDDGQGGHFLATAFVKASGQSPWDSWTPPLYTTYGRLLGAMHALTQHYQPTGHCADRHGTMRAWTLSAGILPSSETVAKEKYQALCAHLHTLPKDNTCLWLTSTEDAHGSNFLVDAAGQITLFDFDDCVYSWI